MGIDLLCYTVRFIFSLFLFAPGLWAWSVGWPHSSHRRRFLRRKVPGQPRAGFVHGLFRRVVTMLLGPVVRRRLRRLPLFLCLRVPWFFLVPVRPRAPLVVCSACIPGPVPPRDVPLQVLPQRDVRVPMVRFRGRRWRDPHWERESWRRRADHELRVALKRPWRASPGRWPWIRAPVVFLACGEWQDGRAMQSSLFCFFLSPRCF